jgi:hypothetical protein
VIDGPLGGGLPKAIELYVNTSISDLSTYGIGVANNGGGTDGEEFTFPSMSMGADTFLYVTSDSAGFTNWFGFDADFVTTAVAVNGDDAVELFCLSDVIDVFGDVETSGSGEPWDYTDGWAYRACATGPDDDVFVLGNWSFSMANALDGDTTNVSASTPFPTGSYNLICIDSACTDTLIIVGPVNPIDTLKASSFIRTTGEVIILDGSSAVFSAPNGVLLNDLFEVEPGAVFEIRFEGCVPPPVPLQAPGHILSAPLLKAVRRN